MDELIEQGTLIAVDEVLKELKRKEDGLYKWAKARPQFFTAVDEPLQHAVRAVLRDHGRLVMHKPGRSACDPFVIALAQIRNAGVVTDEGRSGSLKKPKIPDVCSALRLDCCNLADLFDRCGLVFE
jgi:hypothetical protein